jgi:hypothetical protein
MGHDMGILNRILGIARSGAAARRPASTGRPVTPGRSGAGRGLLSALLNRRRRPM